MTTSEIEIAWAAGLWEGEGTACLTTDKRRSGHYQSPHAALAMTDEEPVRRFHEVMGFGRFRKSEARRAECKPLYWWKCNRKADIRQMAVLMPFLSERRRRQLQIVIDGCVFVDQSLLMRARWANGEFAERKPAPPRVLTTHCKYGHAKENGVCQECGRRRAREYQARQRAAAKVKVAA